MNKLPSFSECKQNVREGKASPLEKFLYLHESAVLDGETFRGQLLEVINDLGDGLND